jgi:PAS domain S-box-containing protein
MSSELETSPPPSGVGSDPYTVRLVGDADAVEWVAANLQGSGLGVDAGDPNGGVAARHPPGPIVWVARPGQASTGRTLVDDAAVWSFPCLVVIPPGGTAPDILAGHPAVESFEVVREPGDAPLLRMRLERLLLLHRRRSQTEAVLHDLPVVVYTRTLDGIVTSVNAEAESFLGRNRSGIVGRRLLEVLPKGVLGEAGFAEMNAGLLARGRHRMRLVGTDADGRRVALDIRALLLRDGHGTPWGAQVVIADLTEEQSAQERLRLEADRNEILATIATATRDMVDLDRVLSASTSIVGQRSGANGVGVFLPRCEGEGFFLQHLWRSSEEIPVPVDRNWNETLDPRFGRVFTDREPFIVRDATAAGVPPAKVATLREIRAQSGIILPIVSEQEVVGGLVLAFPGPRPFPPDEIEFLGRVSDQIGLAIRAARLYRSLAEKLRALDEEQRLRELATTDRQRLLSMLVHDLKNPLAAVLASLELALDRISGDPRLERLLRTSMASARALAGMIDDALLVYRTGETPADRRPEDVAAVLAQPIEEARWMAEVRQVELEIAVPEFLPTVSLDVGRYRRAAANLFSNALKFSRRGGNVVISASIQEADGQSWLVLTVADSGPGVPESITGRLAEPYQRFAGSERIPGTGLGLTVVRAVALAHGGCIQVEPREGAGGGSVFSLWVPA